MLSAVAAALVLTLDPASAPLRQTSSAPPAAVLDTTQEQPLNSKLWVPAGGYGLGAMFGGAAGILVEYSTRQSDNSRNVKAPLLAMGAGFLAGILPGVLLGETARQPDNEKARGTVGVLDVAGSAAIFYAMTQIFRSQ